MKPDQMLSVALLCFGGFFSARAEAPSTDAVKTGLQKATDYLVSISTEGGYLWQYSKDLRERRGEEAATVTQIWVQPPGTPSVGMVYLRVYNATKDERHLRAAHAAANALVRGQLESGGWSYSIEFDPQLRKQWAYRADQSLKSDNPTQKKNITTFDDNNTQSALRFLMAFLDTATNLPTSELKPIQTALNFGLNRMIDAQYPTGAWPQRFNGKPHDPAQHPIRPAHIPTNWTHQWPHQDYSGYYTLNDHTQSDCIHVMLEAYRRSGDRRFLEAAQRGGEFLILAQLPEPQPAWAQQYNFAMEPDWARAFEPPSVCASESGGAVRTLIDLYLESGDKKFLRPIPPFIAWLNRSQLGSNRWARLYELTSNKPIYGDRDGKIHYQLDEISAERRRGYAWQGDFDLPETIARYEEIRRDGREKYLTKQKPRAQPRPPTPAEISAILQRQDEQGRWLVSSGINMRQFIGNMEKLSAYLEAR